MSIIKKIIIFLGIFFISGINQLSAQEIKKIGKYKDWEAMVVSDADGKVCFAQSLPILQAPKTNKRDAKLFVAFRPNDKILSINNKIVVVSKKKRVNVFLSTLGLIGLLFPFTQHLFFPLTPYIKEEFGSTDTITQLAISVPSFIMALMTLIYGSISDRCGRLPVLIVGIISKEFSFWLTKLTMSSRASLI